MATRMHRRTAHRYRLGAIIALALVFALGSFYLLQMMLSQEADVRADLRKNEPDYIVEHFSVVRMNPQGKPRYIVAGSKLSHRPVDDTAIVDNPVVQSLSADTPPMVMHSLLARVDNVNAKVDLLGNVDIQRAASENSKALSIKTNALTIFTDEDIMQTAQPVEIQLGAATMRGVGMKANNATRQLEVADKGEIILPPNQTRNHP